MTTTKAAYNLAYREKNKERLRLSRQQRYQLHKAEILADNADYASRNRERRLSYWKEYHASNRRRWPRKPCTAEQVERRRLYAQRNAVRLRAYWKQYRQDHPEKTKAHNKSNWHKRRALLKNAAINLAEIKEYIFRTRKRKQFTCYYCDKTFSVSLLHFDHVVPLSRGGKGDKAVQAWIRSGQQVLPL